MLHLSDAQRYSIAIVRHFSSNLSLICSCIIVYHVVLRFREERRRSIASSTATRRGCALVTTYHRLLLGFAVADIFFSFFDGLGPLMVPASSGVIYGFGTTSTCTLQAFFRQFFVGTVLYAASLSIYFLLKIRYNVSDNVLCQKFELWLHFVPWTVVVATTTMGMLLEIFNPMSIPELGCWVGPYPPDCFYPEGPPCTRGYHLKERFSLYGFVMVFMWLIVTFLVVLACNTLIYVSIWNQEKRNSQYFAARLQNGRSPSMYCSNNQTKSDMITRDTIEVAQMFPVEEDTANFTDNAHESDGTFHHDDDIKNPTKPETTLQPASREKRARAEETNTSAALSGDSSELRNNNRENNTNSRPGLTLRPSVRTMRKAATQSILYVSTSFLTTVWTLSPIVAFLLNLGDTWRYFFAFMLAFFVPMQGLFYLLIFVRLEYMRLRSINKDWSRLQCLRICLFSPDLRH